MLVLFLFVNKQNNLGGSLHDIHVLLNAFYACLFMLFVYTINVQKKYIARMHD